MSEARLRQTLALLANRRAIAADDTSLGSSAAPAALSAERGAEFADAVSALSALHAVGVVPLGGDGSGRLLLVFVFEGELTPLLEALWRHAGPILSDMLRGAEPAFDDEVGFRRFVRAAQLRPRAFLAAAPELSRATIERDAQLDDWLQLKLDAVAARPLSELALARQLREDWAREEATFERNPRVWRTRGEPLAAHVFSLRPGALRARIVSRALTLLAERGRAGGSAARSRAHWAAWFQLGDELLLLDAADRGFDELLARAEGAERWLLWTIALQTRGFPLRALELALERRPQRRLARWVRAARRDGAVTFSAYPRLDVESVARNQRLRELLSQEPSRESAAALAALL